MLLKRIKIALIVVTALVAVAFCGVMIHEYTHKDVSAPVFTCDSDILEVSVHATDAELCAGMHAYDNMDGDITDQIRVMNVSQLINQTDATVTYLVFDGASNSATYSRTIRYTDYHAPQYTLSKPLIYSTGETVTLLDRLSASDVLDGDISASILLTSSHVSNAIPGSYPITVQVTNSAGDSATLPLTVLINSNSLTLPEIHLKSYLIYVPAGTELDYESYVHYVYDPVDNKISNRLKVTCNADSVDLNTPGVYEAYYYYLGSSGETASVILTIVVE